MFIKIYSHFIYLKSFYTALIRSHHEFILSKNWLIIWEYWCCWVKYDQLKVKCLLKSDLRSLLSPLSSKNSSNSTTGFFGSFWASLERPVSYLAIYSSSLSEKSISSIYVSLSHWDASTFLLKIWPKLSLQSCSWDCRSKLWKFDWGSRASCNGHFDYFSSKTLGLSRNDFFDIFFAMACSRNRFSGTRFSHFLGWKSKGFSFNFLIPLDFALMF